MNKISIRTISQELGFQLMEEADAKFDIVELMKNVGSVVYQFNSTPISRVDASYIPTKPYSINFDAYESILELAPQNVNYTHIALLDYLNQMLFPNGQEETLIREINFLLDCRFTGLFDLLFNYKSSMDEYYYSKHLELLESLRVMCFNGEYDLFLYSRDDLEISSTIIRDDPVEEAIFKIDIEPKTSRKGTRIHPIDERPVVNKVATKISVEQLSFFMKFLYDSNLFFGENVSKTDVRVLASKIFTTPNSANISLNKIEQVMAANSTPNTDKTRKVLQSLIDSLSTQIKEL